MSLVREATTEYPGSRCGDLKIAHYPITYSAAAITKPTSDPLWMLLNGASLATATYPVLFALFGYTYGGVGANFNLPDLTEGRTPIAKGLSSFTTMNASGGEINHVLASGEMPNHAHGHTLSFAAVAHGHSVASSLASADSHSHSLANTALGGTTSFNFVSGTGRQETTSTPATSDPGGGHSHAITFTVGNATSYAVTVNGSVSNSTGAGSAHNNMQPYIVVGGWLVKFG